MNNCFSIIHLTISVTLEFYISCNAYFELIPSKFNIDSLCGYTFFFRFHIAYLLTYNVYFNNDYIKTQDNLMYYSKCGKYAKVQV